MSAKTDIEVEKISRQPITETLESNYMPYAMSVIVSRAIPQIDGFKPAHRKLLYTMYKMGLLTGRRTKSANVVGQTMKLNPHGDAAIYETMVRLTRANNSLLHAYVDSKGNFGKQYSRDMAYAASRYTEVKLEKICEELFKGINKGSVDFTDNYDGTMEEPTLLPVTFPSVLVNINQGIAVGMASQIPSFNMEEVCDATIAYINDPGIDLMKCMPGPDFSSGGKLLLNKKDMKQIYETGRGSFKLRAVYTIDKKNSLIEVSEIPYPSTIEKIIEEITGLVKSNRLKEVNDVRDESDKDGFKIAIEYKRSVDPKKLILKLFRFTEMEKSYSCNFNILVNGNPRLLSMKQILGEWTSWRRSCVRKELAYDLNSNEERLHLLRGLEKILLDIDKAIKIIRETEKASQVIENLMTGFSIDLVQAEYVADIRLRNLNNEYILNRIADIKDLVEQIENIRGILEDPQKINGLIIDELKAVKEKYRQPRKTTIIDESAADEFSDDMMIEDYNVKLCLTSHGYFKKIPLTSLRNANELKTKDDDEILMEIDSQNKADILFFSNKCNVYKSKLYEIEDHRPSDLGEYLLNLLELEQDERIIFIHQTTDYKGQLLLGFENGKMSKILVEAYETKTNRRKLVNAYSKASPIVGIFLLGEDEDEHYVAYSDINKILVYKASQIPMKTTRTNNGVQVMSPTKASKVVKYLPLSQSDILDYEYYRNKNIPSKGYYEKEGTLSNKQLKLDL